MKSHLARTFLCLAPLALLACSSDDDPAVAPSTGGSAGSGGGTAGDGGTGGGTTGGTGTGGDGGSAVGGTAGEGTGGGGSPFPDWPATGLSDPELTYGACTPGAGDLAISRARYHSQLHGFWLAQCIANWTGLVTEMDKVGGGTLPFYTDDDWGGPDQPNIWGGGGPPAVIDWVFTDVGAVWFADDDTDIEYMYQHLLDVNNTSILSAEQIRDGWLNHMMPNEENFLWVSNQTAYDLMAGGMLPPDTSEPGNNPDYEMIDAQLTTEIHGLFAPGRPDIALQIAHLPIRTTAKDNAEWISEFYVIMYSLASYVDSSLSMRDQVLWLADQARARLPAGSFPAGMYDFIKAEYEANADKNDWESTRDGVYDRYQVNSNDGYVFRDNFDGGINFAASLVSLFYGEGDLLRTIQIGTLTGWDSDNPTATWGGLLGFMLGKEGVEQAFNKTDFSETYWIGRTRINFPDQNGGEMGEDSFPLMAERGLYIVDRAVMEEMGGCVDLDDGVWYVPDNGGAF